MICFYHLINRMLLWAFYSLHQNASQLMWIHIITEKKNSHNNKNMKHKFMVLQKQKTMVLPSQSVDQSDLNSQSSYGFWRPGVGALDQQ